MGNQILILLLSGLHKPAPHFLHLCDYFATSDEWELNESSVNQLVLHPVLIA